MTEMEASSEAVIKDFEVFCNPQRSLFLHHSAFMTTTESKRALFQTKHIFPVFIKKATPFALIQMFNNFNFH